MVLAPVLATNSQCLAMTKAEFLARESGKSFTALMRLTGLRPVTINNYARRVSIVATTLGKVPEELTCKDAELFVHRAARSGMSNINAATTCVALKFYISRTLNKPWQLAQFPRVHRHRKQRSRPLDRAEIETLLAHTASRKYRLMFALIYGSGLRVGEACRLQICDVDFRGGKLYIRNSKGGRHRDTVLAERLAGPLRDYINDRRPEKWLFPSNRFQYASETLFPQILRARPVSTETAQREFRRVRDALAMPGKVTIHSLRHSFATHLVEYECRCFPCSGYWATGTLARRLVICHRWAKPW